MKKSMPSSQRGQALVMLALAAIGLFAPASNHRTQSGLYGTCDPIRE